MALADDLINVPVRERSATGDRYEYQTLWGLTLVFQEHASGRDYAIVFEFHDDIALLNDSDTPTEVRFYQVKSKETIGGWTLPSLLHREETKNKDGTRLAPSHLDKMYDNIDKFSGFVLSVDFVSNQGCGFNAGKKSFRFSECKSDHLKKIIESVKIAYPAATEAQIGLLGFEHTDLSLADAASHARGKLQAFVAEYLGPVSFSPEAAYLSISDECRRKANFKGEYCNLNQAIRNKGVTKSNVHHWLDTIRRNVRSPIWDNIVSEVKYPLSERLIMRIEYDNYRAAALNTSDRAMHRVRMDIYNEIPTVIADRSLDLRGMVEPIFDKCQGVANEYLTPFTPEKLRAMIIYEIYTYEPSSKIQVAYPES